MADKPWRDPDTLEELYLGEEMGSIEIGDRFGVGHKTILKWLHRHDISVRSREEGSSLAHRGSHAGFHTTLDGYEVWTTSECDGHNGIYLVHRLVAVAEYGIDAVAGKVVHHKNGIPWDNRPANLEPLSASEHRRRHESEIRAARQELVQRRPRDENGEFLPIEDSVK